MLKVDLSSFQNHSFDRKSSKWRELLWILLGNFFLTMRLPFASIVGKILLRIFGSTLGENIVLKNSLNIKFPWKLKIGNNSWIGEKVWIDNLVQVTIGDNVCISQGAMLLTGNHNYKKSTFDLIVGEIHIEEGAWIGAKSIVCPGVRVGSHAVLAVGSVATADLKPYTIYQGNPARPIRKRVIN